MSAYDLPGLQDIIDYQRAEIASLTAEVEEWKNETNYYQAAARKLRAALEAAERALHQYSGQKALGIIKAALADEQDK